MEIAKKSKGEKSFLLLGSKRTGSIPYKLSKAIGISVPAVGYSVERGSKIAKENDYKLREG